MQIAVGEGDRRRDLLYLSPVVPAITGNGLAMRAGLVLHLLARHYRVHLLVCPKYPSPTQTLHAELAQSCEDVVIQPFSGHADSVTPRRLLARMFGRSPHIDFGAVDFSVIHVFRLSMLAESRRYTENSSHPQRHLDLDDVDSRAYRRLAALYRLRADDVGAAKADLLARRAEEEEADVLPTWDRVYVCSEMDRDDLVQRGCRQARVLPNAVRSLRTLPPPRHGGAFTFLFVGTLSYYPNEDGVRYFCEHVLPVIRGRAPRAVRVVVVGFGANPSLAPLAAMPEVELVGHVPDVTPYYDAADVVIVPLRAGGGTRIKILEAFAYGRPVVSTPQGCEGIPACDGNHLLLAHTVQDLAEQCLRLLNDRTLAERLVENATVLVRDHFTLDALQVADPCNPLNGHGA